MNKIYLLLFVLLFVSPVAAYKTEHRGVPIYIYHYEINESKCLETLDLIPYKYWETIRVFRFFKGKNDRFEGLYFWRARYITETDGCDLDTLVHELAHHKQDLDGAVWSKGDMHRADFIAAEEQIWREINESRN